MGGVSAPQLRLHSTDTLAWSGQHIQLETRVIPARLALHFNFMHGFEPVLCVVSLARGRAVTGL